MSYIFMKILERRAASYDAGIEKYAAGDFAQVRDAILSQVKPDDRVLDIGCGPGTFAIECAKKGATVEAVDINPQMLYTASLAARKTGVEDKMHFQQSSATELEFEEAAFDLVVCSLSMSELREVEQLVVMQSAFDYLKPGGRLMIADEVVPEPLLSKLWYHVRRTILLLLTYLLTRTTTSPVREMEEKFRSCGFDIQRVQSYERGSLKLVVGVRGDKRPPPVVLPPYRLSDWTEILGQIWCYFTLPFKDVPIKTGLYKFGEPAKNSPVLVTANYLLTFTSVRKHLRGIDCYLLVIDTRGINVWCAAGEGNFSAGEIRNSLVAARAGDIVETRKLILPKLSANGVRYRDIKRLTGWDAVFGPVYAKDIPKYLSTGLVKTEFMQRVGFGFAERLRVAIPFATFVAFLAALPLLVFHNLYSPMIPVIGFAAGFIFPLAFYILPTDSFFKKGMTLGFVGAGLAVLYLWSAGASGKDVVQWALIIVGLTTFIAMDFSGMSSVSNYSRIKKEYSVVLPFLGLIVLSYIMISFLWR